jgi:hypothetical protein
MSSINLVNASSTLSQHQIANLASIPNVCIREITQFLKFDESILNLGGINRSIHWMIISKDGLSHKKVSLKASKAIEFLNSSKQPKSIEALEVKGNENTLLRADPVDKVRNNQITIKTLSFKAKEKPIHFTYIKEILEALPNLSSLEFKSIAEDYSDFQYLTQKYGDKLFDPAKEPILSDRIKTNLASLTKLIIDTSSIHPHGMNAILKCAHAIKTLFLKEYPISDALLQTLNQKKDLSSLILIDILPKVNYGLLTDIQKLEEFTPHKHISLEELVGIINANPNIKRLDLSNCSAPIEKESDRLLTTIGKNLQSLENLSLPKGMKITREGIAALVQGCKYITKLEMTEVKWLTVEMVTELKKCLNLESLNISWSQLGENVFLRLTDIKHLTHLDVSGCFGIDRVSLTRIGQLVNLTDLNVSCLMDLDDEHIYNILYSCTKLLKLNVKSCSNLTRESIRIILRATKQDKRPLKELYD